MERGALFMKRMLDLPCPRIAVENPIMHKYAADIVGRRQDFITQPWHFGDNYTKATCFWTRNLPPLVPDSDLDGTSAFGECHNQSPGPDRWKKRSRTYPGIARAMAQQWGKILQVSA